MSKIQNSSSTERTSIHEMLKETPPVNENSGGMTNSESRNSIYSNKTGSGSSSVANSPPQSVPTTPNEDSTVIKTGTSRIENIKNWSISTYKCTKQLMFEKLGKTSRTVDAGIYSFILTHSILLYLKILQN